MLRWYPPPLLRVVLALTFAPIFFLTVFAIMCVFDPDTPWAMGPLQGPGVSGDFFFIAAPLGVGWAALVLGWRGAGTVFKFLIMVWLLLLSGVFVALLLSTGDVILRGEAIDLSISLALLGPVLSVSALVGAGIWIVRDVRHGNLPRFVVPLQPRNWLALAIAGAALAGCAGAFWHDHREIGVVACAVGLIGCHEFVRPVNPSEELRKVLLHEGSAPQ